MCPGAARMIIAMTIEAVVFDIRDDVRHAIRERLGLDDRPLAESISDIWRKYLGTANTELVGVRPPDAPTMPYRDPEQQLRPCQRKRTGRQRARRSRRRDHPLPRVRHEQARPWDLCPHLRASASRADADGAPNVRRFRAVCRRGAAGGYRFGHRHHAGSPWAHKRFYPLEMSLA